MSSFFSSSQCTKACLKITSAKIKDKYQYDFKSIDWTVLSHQIDLRKDDFKDLLFHHSHYYSFKDEIRKINNEIDRNTKDFDD